MSGIAMRNGDYSELLSILAGLGLGMVVLSFVM